LNLTQRVEMAEMTVADLRQLLAATMEANKATAEAWQANALRITEINSALDKLALTQQDLVRSAAKVESTIDRVIQANTGLDRSVEELKQSMERVATRLTSMETAAPKLSTPESVDRDPGLLRPEGHRPQQRFQGTGLGEDLTSSRVG
jgi:methyl-accepting chemotaxis protein